MSNVLRGIRNRSIYRDNNRSLATSNGMNYFKKSTPLEVAPALARPRGLWGGLLLTGSTAGVDNRGAGYLRRTDTMKMV